MKREQKHSLKRTLQIRFVLLALLAAALLLGLIDAMVLLRSRSQIVKKADRLIRIIQTAPNSPEIGDAHYFSVVLFPGEHTASVDLTHTSLMREKAAAEMGQQVLKSGKQRGFLNGYRFELNQQAGNARVLFLSRKLPLETLKDTQKLLIGASLLGLGLTAAVLALVSGQVVAPLVAADEKQKAFVTSASHALKTPVAVILGDTQLLQMEYEDNEWLLDIEKQARRLTEMTQSLVTLARCDEGIKQGSFIDFPISDVAEDIAASFQSLATGQRLDFRTELTKGLSFYGDEKALRELMAILLDNAFRYCPDRGQILFALEKRNRGLVICVRNTAENVHQEELCHFTDRFYRGSTAKTTPGSGLGLAIAQSIVYRHRGKLTISAPTEKEIEARVIL